MRKKFDIFLQMQEIVSYVKDKFHIATHDLDRITVFCELPTNNILQEADLSSLKFESM